MDEQSAERIEQLSQQVAALKRERLELERKLSSMVRAMRVVSSHQDPPEGPRPDKLVREMESQPEPVAYVVRRDGLVRAFDISRSNVEDYRDKFAPGGEIVELFERPEDGQWW